MRGSSRRGVAAVVLLTATAAPFSAASLDGTLAEDVPLAPAGASPAGPAADEPAQILWQAGFEGGNLLEWWAPSTAEAEGDNGGGEYNSGVSDAAASTDVAHSGAWSGNLTITAGASVPGGAESGTRLFRWQEARAHRELLYEAWFYFPTAYTLTADPRTGRYWNVFQFKSSNENLTRNDPFWFLNVQSPSPGTLRAQLTWWFGHGLEGPHADEEGWRNYDAPVELPVGRWVRFRVLLRQSKDFDGRVLVWQDDQLIFAQEGVRTGWRSGHYNAWQVDQSWSVNNYSDGLVPGPSALYVDDARISLLGG